MGCFRLARSSESCRHQPNEYDGNQREKQLPKRVHEKKTCEEMASRRESTDRVLLQSYLPPDVCLRKGNRLTHASCAEKTPSGKDERHPYGPMRIVTFLPRSPELRTQTPWCMLHFNYSDGGSINPKSGIFAGHTGEFALIHVARRLPKKNFPSNICLVCMEYVGGCRNGYQISCSRRGRWIFRQPSKYVQNR